LRSPAACWRQQKLACVLLLLLLLVYSQVRRKAVQQHGVPQHCLCCCRQAYLAGIPLGIAATLPTLAPAAGQVRPAAAAAAVAVTGRRCCKRPGLLVPATAPGLPLHLLQAPAVHGTAVGCAGDCRCPARPACLAGIVLGPSVSAAAAVGAG
jgi:hypothetical protein